MTKQPEDWLDDVPGDDIEDEDDEIIWVSKSEIKRDAEELKRLGAEIVDLGKNALDKIPLDADLRAAIELAQRIKMEGRRRQLQLIGKMLRQRDVEPIRQALDKLKNRHNQQVVLFHKLENLRDRLIDQGDDAIAEVLNLWPDADRQQLRTLIRNAKKEKEGNKPPKSAECRVIFVVDVSMVCRMRCTCRPDKTHQASHQALCSNAGCGVNALSGLRTLYQAEAELLRSFRLLRQTIQQFLMDPTKTAVAHHQNMVARLSGFHHHICQRIHIATPVCRLNAGFCHFCHLPRNMRRLQQEDFIGTT